MLAFENLQTNKCLTAIQKIQGVNSSILCVDVTPSQSVIFSLEILFMSKLLVEMSQSP